MQDPDLAYNAADDPPHETDKCPICFLVNCDGHTANLRQSGSSNSHSQVNLRFAPNTATDNAHANQLPSLDQTAPNQTEPQSIMMQSCATEDPTLLQQTAKVIQDFNSQAATSKINSISSPAQTSPATLIISPRDTTDTNATVTAPLAQTNPNLSQQSAKTIVLSSIGSLHSPSLQLPSLTSPVAANTPIVPTVTPNINPNKDKSRVHAPANPHTHQNSTKNVQQSGLKNVSATPIEEQKDVTIITMGAAPPVAARAPSLSPLTMASQAAMPADTPSPTPTDLIAPAPQRPQTIVSAPQNYNTQAAQFNDNSINGRRVFGSKYRFNISTSTLQDSARFITLRIVPDSTSPWEEVTSGSQALSYLHALCKMMEIQQDRDYPCWGRLKPQMILNCAVEQTGLIYAIDANWIGMDNLPDFSEMVIQEFQDYVNSVQMTVFGKTPNICDLKVPWDLTDNYTIVWVTAGMHSDNLIATKNMVGQHHAFIHECYDLAAAFGLESKLAYGERGTTATKTLQLRGQGNDTVLATEEKQDRTYNLGYKLVFLNLTQEEKSNLTHLQAQPWYGYNFRYSVEKSDTTAKRALKLIPGCELCFQFHSPFQNCDENEPARKEAIEAIKRSLKLQNPNISKMEMANLIYDAVSNLQACARCAGYHEQDIYHADGMCPHALSAQACKFCLTSEFQQQPAFIHDTEKSLRCLRMRADAITYVNRNHGIKQQAWKQECQHYNITPQSLAIRTNIDTIISKLDAINLNTADTSPAPPQQFLINMHSVPTPNNTTKPKKSCPPQAMSQAPPNRRKPPLRVTTKLNPNAPTYDPDPSRVTPSPYQ